MTNAAPLAQLHDHDHNLWRLLYAAAQRPSPGTDTVTQALAAALLGDIELAKRIIHHGIGYYWTRDWPQLVAPTEKGTRP